MPVSPFGYVLGLRNLKEIAFVVVEARIEICLSILDAQASF